jgi:cytochrome c553
MIRHILALLGFLVTLATFWHLYNVDVEIDAMGKVKEIFRKSDLLVELGKKSASSGELTGGSQQLTPIGSATDMAADADGDKNKEAEDKLKALREKAGNVGGFKVSKLYKIKCSSCHGYNGEGGVGPKLIGHTYDKVSVMLKDFKSGEKKNYVMYGLLQNLSDEELDTLAKEVGEFQQKADALK